MSQAMGEKARSIVMKIRQMQKKSRAEAVSKAKQVMEMMRPDTQMALGPACVTRSKLGTKKARGVGLGVPLMVPLCQIHKVEQAFK